MLTGDFGDISKIWRYKMIFVIFFINFADLITYVFVKCTYLTNFMTFDNMMKD